MAGNEITVPINFIPSDAMLKKFTKMSPLISPIKRARGSVLGEGGYEPGPKPEDTLKKLFKLYKIDLYWRWIKGTWATLTKYVPLLKGIADAIAAAISIALTALILPFLPEIVKFLKLIFQISTAIMRWSRENNQAIRDFVGKVVEVALLNLDKVIKAIPIIAEFGASIAELLPGGKLLIAIFSGLGKAFGFLGKLIGPLIEKLGLKGLTSAAGKLLGSFLSFANPLMWASLAADILGALSSVIFGADSPITHFLSAVSEATDVIGWLIAAFKDLSDMLGFTAGGGGALKGKLATFWSEFKQGVGLANGGVVTSPTQALIGEAGPEAVIPLDKMGSMGGEVSVKVFIDGKEFRGMIREEIQKSNRTLFNARGAVGV